MKLSLTQHNWLQMFLDTNKYRVGDNNINETEAEEEEYEIKSIEIHPDFNVGPYLNNDIAIVTIGNNTNGGLEENAEGHGIRFGDFVGAACLPTETFW